MAHRPNLSITLPPTPDFQFPQPDGQVPKTPEPCSHQDTVSEPPPPPKQTFKLRRKRNSTLSSQDVVSDVVVPTIEMSEDAPITSSPLAEPQFTPVGLLAPASAAPRYATPKTPEPRAKASTDEMITPNEWDLITNSGTHAHSPGRAPSVLSDSSISTTSSSPFSAMPTSPDSVTTDPFMDDDAGKDKILFSPHDSSPCAKRHKRHPDPKWTSAMDEHLWMTFMSFLSDPTLTPFKLMPGHVPPLGICHRVVSKARKTWKPHRHVASDFLDVPHSDIPGTIRASEAVMQPWPIVDKHSRKRLRRLCKAQPSLHMHYQRLLRTRSPSPFASSSPAVQSPEPPSNPSSFAGRDMNVSLVTATAPSMQPEGPLAQLANPEMDTGRRPQSQRITRPDGWFDRIGRSQAHQKSLSLQSGLGLEPPSPYPSAPLASPFEASSSRSHLLHSMTTTKSLGRTNIKEGPSLDAPFEGDPTMRRSLKRRFRSDEEKPKRLPVKDVFGIGHAPNSVVRNRGFSMGAVAHTTGLFDPFAPQASTPLASSVEAPQMELDQEMSEAPLELPCASNLPSMGSRSVPRRLAEPTPRLGSPFVENCSSRQNNTFPRSLFRTPGNPQPFQQRLQELADQRAAAITPRAR